MTITQRHSNPLEKLCLVVTGASRLLVILLLAAVARGQALTPSEPPAQKLTQACALPTTEPLHPPLKDVLPCKVVGAALNSYDLVDNLVRGGTSGTMTVQAQRSACKQLTGQNCYNAVYDQTLREQYNTIVAENAFEQANVWKGRTSQLKDHCPDNPDSRNTKENNWGHYGNSPNCYDFSVTDEIASYAYKNHLKLRGHALIFNPAKWLSNEEKCKTKDCVYPTRDFLKTMVKEYIHDFVGRYNGMDPAHPERLVVQWDVLNEAIVLPDHPGQEKCPTGSRTLRCDFWRINLGDDYPVQLFKWAADETVKNPSVKIELYYNDYCADGGSADYRANLPCEAEKTIAVYQLVKEWKVDKQAPIDGVGWETHVPAGYEFGPAQRAWAQSYDALHLQVMVTELDARIQCSPYGGCDVPPTEAQLGDQANTYASVMKFCMDTRNCAGVVSWGFSDAYTWIGNAAYIGFHAPLPFWATSADGKFYDPKPAYWAMVGLIGGR